MSGLAYLNAPWSLRVLIERHWKFIPLMLLYTWFTVDGCYWLYWSYKDPVALEWMRVVNFPASLSLYVLCGLVWYFHGSLNEMKSRASDLFRDRSREKPCVHHNALQCMVPSGLLSIFGFKFI